MIMELCKTCRYNFLKQGKGYETETCPGMKSNVVDFENNTCKEWDFIVTRVPEWCKEETRKSNRKFWNTGRMH